MTIALAVLIVVIFTVLLARIGRVKLRISGGVSVRDLREFSSALNQVTVDYFTANYNGNPEELEGTLRGLLPVARGIAAMQPRPIDDEMICTLIITTVAANRFARHDQVESVLEDILRSERQAA
jgi:hypothetical protein